MWKECNIRENTILPLFFVFMKAKRSCSKMELFRTLLRILFWKLCFRINLSRNSFKIYPYWIECLIPFLYWIDMAIDIQPVWYSYYISITSNLRLNTWCEVSIFMRICKSVETKLINLNYSWARKFNIH